MSSTHTFETMNADRDLKATARLLHHAFGSPLDKSEEWITRAGCQNMRVLRAASGVPEACLLEIPMGQYFGGRAVPMTGIAAVATAPESRGRGLALEMMRESMRGLAARGVPLSGLYPATQTLYRAVGYEQAGYRCEITIPVTGLAGGKRGPRIVSLDADAQATLPEKVYKSWASMWDGALDRGEYIWGRVRTTRETAFEAFGVEEGGQLKGYVYLNQARKPETGRHDVVLSDIAWLTPTAGRALLRFLADFSTIGDNVILFGGPGHPILMLMDGVQYSLKRRDYWMLRILRVKEALEMRGYPHVSSASCCFEVSDDLVPENRGTWTLTVENGRAAVARGGGGDAVKCDIRGLASLYSGWVTPRQAAGMGWVEGSDAALAAATRLFPGGCPWMAEMF